jgi:putative iron-dependent peroxidase
MRFNMPFGRVGAREFGTYYIAYARTPELIEQMLSNMFIGNPAGNTDRILEFSTAVTGSLFFAPSAELLENLSPPGPGPAPDPRAEAETPAPGDGSLNIGSLRDH